MTQLQKVKLLIGIAVSDTSKDNLIDLLLEQAKNEFLEYCHRDDIPDRADNVVIDMAVIKYNLLGSEGLSNQSYSGLSESYANYPPQLLHALNRYRKAVIL